MYESIGDRIRRLRVEQDPKLTQRDLAERAGVSVDLIRKLEQGRKQTALVGSLHKIARALGVDVAELVSRGTNRPATVGLDSGVPAIRQAVTALDDLADPADTADTADTDDEPASASELGHSVTYAWGAYWAGRYDLLSGSVPTLIRSARGAVRASRTGEVALLRGLLTESYQVAACLAVRLGYTDLAHIALERGLAASQDSEEPRLRHAAIVGSMSWLLLSQGRSPEAHRLAVREADNVEPRMSTARPEDLSLWGNLLITAATATARGGDGVAAADLLGMADAAATRLGGQRNDYQTVFGPANVVMQSVDVAVVTGEFGRALDLARTMPDDVQFPLAARARHMADVAYAQTNLGRDAAAERTLLQIERIAPDWMRYQTFPKAIVQELRERERRSRTPRLRALARRLGIE